MEEYLSGKDNEILEIDDATKNYLKTTLNIDIAPVYCKSDKKMDALE